MDQREKKRIILIVVVAVLFIISIFVRYHPERRLWCQKQALVPRFDPKLSKNISSYDDYAMANFQGFIALSPKVFPELGDFTIMPIHLEEISYEKQFESTRLSLRTDCATFIISLENKNHAIEFKTIEAVIEKWATPYSTWSCHIEPIESNVYDSNHYLCDRVQRFDCLIKNSDSTKKLMMRLFVQRLEFELGDDRFAHSQKRFNHEAAHCPENRRQHESSDFHAKRNETVEEHSIGLK